MLKHLAHPCTLALLLVGSLSHADERPSIEGSLWYIDGEAGFVNDLPDGVTSRLEFPLEGIMADLTARVPLTFTELPLVVRARVSTSLDVDGTTRDTDFTAADDVFIFSTSDAEADVLNWSADLVYMRPLNLGLFGGVFIGYQVDTYDFRMSNLDQREGGGFRARIPGDTATYDAEFSGVRIGGMVHYYASNDFKLSAELVLLPALEGSGDGFWLLRDYPFHQEADGDGIIFSVRGEREITDEMTAFLGVRWVQLSADEDGRESGTADGTSTYENLPIVAEISGDYFGVEFGASVAF